MNLDLNEAPVQFELIPDGTVCRLKANLKRADDGDWLKISKNGSEMLDMSFKVTSGLYQGQEFRQYFVVDGGRQNEAGKSIAGQISRAKLRAMIESAKQINPTDTSAQAAEARRVASWEAFNGLAFVGKIKIEKGGPNPVTGTNYPDRNALDVAVTPDKPEYKAVMEGGEQSETAPPEEIDVPF